MQYVIGCDVGTQSVKAALVALDGRVLHEAASGYAPSFPRPAWAEQAPQLWMDALAQAIRALRAEARFDPREVAALGLATQVDGVVPVDAGGRALRNAIIWMDRRAVAQCEAAASAADPAHLLAISGLNLDPSHVAPKIRWIAEHEPAVDAQTAHYLLPGSYVALALTGELGVDYSNASSTLLMDVRARRWSPELCALFGVDPARLAPILPATAPLGTLRPAAAETLGLSQGTLVVVGCGDEHAACLGAGTARPGVVCDIAGTAEPVCVASAEPRFDPGGLVETHCHADPDAWLIENPGFVSGANLRWFRDEFAAEEVRRAAAEGVSAYELLTRAAAGAPPGAEGLILLPCLMGAMSPTWNANARGAFVGFTLAHNRAHFARAVLEASAYAVRDITDRMAEIGLAPHEIRVVGGGARSRLWRQIKADVTGLPVALPHTTETTALGAAMLALVAAGAFPSLVSSADAVVRVVERTEPQPAAQARYEEMYQVYRAAYFALAPVFERAARGA
ncbi:MAG TPA: FGGY family carbohydrate kinase [Roseiflexaceae bacterium]|nr:FGGY family carbohydrate kinase [Roseiflexaceae bacterium]